MLNVPTSLTAGDTWSWTADLADYPAPTWTLTFYLRGATKNYPVIASPDGTAHLVNVAAATTVGYAPGRYAWTARAAAAGVSVVVGTGWTDVIADPAATALQDPRTVERRMLDNVNAYLANPTSMALASITVGPRQLSKYGLSELMEMKRELEGIVSRQDAGARAGLGRQIRVRFGRA